MTKSYNYYYPSITVSQDESLVDSHAPSLEPTTGHTQAYTKPYNEQAYFPLKNTYDDDAPILNNTRTNYRSYSNALKPFKSTDQLDDAHSGGINHYPTCYQCHNPSKMNKIKTHRPNKPKWLPPPFSFPLVSFLLRFLFFLILRRVRFFVFQRRR
jgi:hypothetical protein